MGKIMLKSSADSPKQKLEILIGFAKSFSLTVHLFMEENFDFPLPKNCVLINFPVSDFCRSEIGYSLVLIGKWKNFFVNSASKKIPLSFVEALIIVLFNSFFHVNSAISFGIAQFNLLAQM